MEFFGRHEEMAILNNCYASGKFEFVAIYGRRRVGKTTLIEEFVKGKRAIFYTGRSHGALINLRMFAEEAGRVLGRDIEAEKFDDVFEAVASEKGRIILVIDEFPYLAKAAPEVLDSLQIAIDRKFKNTKVFLILCGSSMSFMKRQVLGEESPLYGRRTEQIEVRPMGYLEACECLKGRDAKEKLCIYGIAGGIPMYLERFVGRKSIAKVIRREFLEGGRFLAHEPANLMMEELGNSQRHNDVVKAIAEGRNRVGEIVTYTGMERVNVIKCLKDLQDLDLVEKEMPVGDRGGKKTRYALKDNLFRFYYSVIDGREHMLADDRSLKTDIERYMGHAFEGICRQYLQACGYPQVGSWWGRLRDGETADIDAIGVRRIPDGGREAMFAECKFTNRVVTMEELDLLRRRSEEVRGIDVRHYALFSRSGFDGRLKETAAREGVMLVSLQADGYVKGLFPEETLPEDRSGR